MKVDVLTGVDVPDGWEIDHTKNVTTAEIRNGRNEPYELCVRVPIRKIDLFCPRIGDVLEIKLPDGRVCRRKVVGLDVPPQDGIGPTLTNIQLAEVE